MKQLDLLEKMVDETMVTIHSNALFSFNADFWLLANSIVELRRELEQYKKGDRDD